MSAGRPTRAEMERVLLAYGRRINEGEARESKGIPNSTVTVGRYCRALRRVWDMAAAMAQEAALAPPRPGPMTPRGGTR
jgi:hypothetical protein